MLPEGLVVLIVGGAVAVEVGRTAVVAGQTGQERALVQVVGDGVVVVVGIADIAQAVAVVVQFVGIVGLRTVVHVVGNAVLVIAGWEFRR